MFFVTVGPEKRQKFLELRIKRQRQLDSQLFLETVMLHQFHSSVMYFECKIIFQQGKCLMNRFSMRGSIEPSLVFKIIFRQEEYSIRDQRSLLYRVRPFLYSGKQIKVELCHRLL